MSYQEQLHPWVVYRLLPNCQRVMVDRFRKRNDAEEYCKAIQPLSPNAQFEIVFEATPTSHNPTTWHNEGLPPYHHLSAECFTPKLNPFSQ